MTTVTKVCQFDLPVRELWDLIGDFGNMAKWAGRDPESCVSEGDGIGSLRTITLDNGQKVVDRLEACGAFSYSYSIVTSPFPLASYRATMEVSAVASGHSELKWSGEFEPEGITVEEAKVLVAGMYKCGTDLMQETIAKRLAK